MLDRIGVLYSFSITEKINDLEELSFLKESSSRIIEQDELSVLSLEELDIAYNEIFARHGHDFQTKKLREYFGSRIWYKPIYKKTVSLDELSDIERANVQTIKDEIARRK